MALISQTAVYAAYNVTGECCLHCEKCDNECLLKRTRNYLLNFTRNGRQIDKGALNEQFAPDPKKFDLAKLKSAYESIENLCQACGENHEESCFVNNSRKAMQMLLFGQIKPFNGYK